MLPMPNPFDPFILRSITARNRIWASPMCTYSVHDRSGIPTDWHLVHLGSLALGGSGVVFAEASAVHPAGRISFHDTGLWNDEQVEGWKPITAFIAQQGAIPAVQLAHAGRKASIWPDWGFEGKTGSVPHEQGGWQTYAPSAITFDGYAPPVALTTDEIAALVENFGSAAVRAVAAGFKVLEIHAAHGYLIHQFLSPLSNHRIDEYGGSLEHRAKFLLNIISRIRKLISSDIALSIRFSGSDWIEGGWNEQQTAIVSQWAHELGADFFDISSGGLQAGVRIPLKPGYQVPLAHYIKSNTKKDVSAVGLITTSQHIAEIIESGQADTIMIGRQLLREPHFPLRVADELNIDIDYWPKQYLRAKPKHKK